MAGDRVRDPDPHASSSCRRERRRRRAEHGSMLAALGQRHLVEAECVGALRDHQRVSERAFVRQRQAETDERHVSSLPRRAEDAGTGDDVLRAVLDVVHGQHEQIEAVSEAGDSSRRTRMAFR